jgi:hypothetical protein
MRGMSSWSSIPWHGRLRVAGVLALSKDERQSYLCCSTSDENTSRTSREGRMDQLYFECAYKNLLGRVCTPLSSTTALRICFIPSAVSLSSAISALLGMYLLDSSLPAQFDLESCKIEDSCVNLSELLAESQHADMAPFHFLIPLKRSGCMSDDKCNMSYRAFEGRLNPAPITPTAIFKQRPAI